MSLDVYLKLTGYKSEQQTLIPIRENGQTVMLTAAEWHTRYPDREPVKITTGNDETVYSANITHNLNRMASAAGLYEALWRPDEYDLTKAAQLIEPLHDGIEVLISDPDRFRQLNPANGWGDYDGLVEFVRRYLNACKTWPDAGVSVSR